MSIMSLFRVTTVPKADDQSRSVVITHLILVYNGLYTCHQHNPIGSDIINITPLSDFDKLMTLDLIS